MSVTGKALKKPAVSQGITTVIGDVTVYGSTCPVQQAKFARRISDWCDRVEARQKREAEEAAHATD